MLIYNYENFLNICKKYSTVTQHPDTGMGDIFMEYWASEDVEPTNMISLEMLLDEIYPDIPYLTYRKLCRVLIKYGFFWKTGWIENKDRAGTIDMEYKYIDLKDLYDYLSRLSPPLDGFMP